MKRGFQLITFVLFLPWIYLVSILPFFLLYRISDALFILVYYVFRYRRKVVWMNLRYAFPDKSKASLRKLCRSFYQYLCDLLLEHIRGLHMTPRQLLARCKFQNPELLQKLYKQGRHVILVTGHYGNWEWAGNVVALQTSYQLCAVYKHLSHPYFDTFMYRVRTRFDRKLIHQNQVLRAMLHYDDTPKATAILADQAPPSKHAYLTTFLGQPTHVFLGVEKLAQRFNHAVVYMSAHRIKRGYYTLQANLLFAEPTRVLPYTITKAHIQQLEASIHKQPTTWLWSHQRWKHQDG